MKIAGFLDFKIDIKNLTMKILDIVNAMIFILLSSVLRG
jgi:hypothetical protein